MGQAGFQACVPDQCMQQRICGKRSCIVGIHEDDEGHSDVHMVVAEDSLTCEANLQSPDVSACCSSKERSPPNRLKIKYTSGTRKSKSSHNDENVDPSQSNPQNGASIVEKRKPNLEVDTGASNSNSDDPPRLLRRRRSTDCLDSTTTTIRTDRKGTKTLVRRMTTEEINDPSSPASAASIKYKFEFESVGGKKEESKTLKPVQVKKSEEAHLILRAMPEIANVCFIDANQLHKLEAPWPRCQEVDPNVFEIPRSVDFVIAVSHMWHFQTHPDPTGKKGPMIQRLVEQAKLCHRQSQQPLLFVDFLSLTQPPFKEGQQPRTPSQAEDFSVALRTMPSLYLHADAVILLEEEPLRTSPISGDGDLVVVDCADLERVQLMQVGQDVQVAHGKSSGKIEPFDFVRSINSETVHSLDDVKRLLNAPGCKCKVATVQKAPYGRRNRVAAAKRGWIYLERFVAMVKVAMREDDDAEVVFSNSRELVQQIKEGGQRLRLAGKSNDEKELRCALDHHVKELKSKTFSATSTDKVNNAGGNGGQKSSAPSSDQKVVESIMWEMVEYLYGHWDELQRTLSTRRRERFRKAVRKVQAIRALGGSFSSCPHPRDGFQRSLTTGASSGGGSDRKHTIPSALARAYSK